MSSQLINITECGRKFNISRQAIFLVIYANRLPAKKVKGKWTFKLQDWEDYLKSKYNRIYSTKNGVKIFDIMNGPYSPTMISNIWGIHKQRVYHYIRKGDIPFKKLGKSYLIKKQDVLNSLHILLPN